MVYSSYKKYNSINHSDQCLSKDVHDTAAFCWFKKSISFRKLSSHDGFIIKYFRHFLVLNWFLIFFLSFDFNYYLNLRARELIVLNIRATRNAFASKKNITWMDQFGKTNHPIPFWFSYSEK